VASVVVTSTARRNLAALIETHSLPPSTIERVRRALEPLGRFPSLGAPLEGRWSGFRFILGPWRWMIIVYSYDESIDQVAVVTIRDARSAAGPKTER
jgi:plasmid stabilization system protein ParE